MGFRLQIRALSDGAGDADQCRRIGSLRVYSGPLVSSSLRAVGVVRSKKVAPALIWSISPVPRFFG